MMQVFDFSFKSFFDGRASIISFFGFVCDVICLNVHCDPSISEAGCIRRVRSIFNIWDASDNALFIFTGDPNWVF